MRTLAGVPMNRSFRMLTVAVIACGSAFPRAAAAQISVLTNTVEERSAAPGERYTGTIVIANPSGEAQTARIFLTDYSFKADGTTEYGDAGGMARSNASWITPQTNRVLVPANSSVTVSYTVAVPARESLSGSYWSTIIVEGAPPTPSSNDSRKGTVSIGAVIRYAVQVATHLRNPGSRAVVFDGERLGLTPAKNSALEVDVANSGERAYRPVLWIEVYDEQGTLRALAKQSRGLLYPGSSLRQHFDLGVLPPGSYKAVLFADTGEDAVFAKQLALKF